MFGGKKDYWNYICDCVETNKSLNDGIKFVKANSEVGVVNSPKNRPCPTLTDILHVFHVHVLAVPQYMTIDCKILLVKNKLGSR